MQIVHLGPASDVPVLHRFGGAVQRRIWEMARLQAKRGHQVIVYSFDKQTSTRLVEGVEVRFLRCFTPHPPRQLEFLIRALVDLRLRERHVNLVHFHGVPEGAALARGLADLTALSFDYYIYRGGRRAPWGAAYRKMLQSFDLLLPCSEYCRGQASKYWEIDAGRMEVLFNGVSLRQFAPDPVAGARERKALGLGLEEPVLLYVGRVCEQKGSHVLLEGYQRLRTRGVAARLVVAGPIGQFGRSGDGDWPRRIAEAGGIYLGPVEEERLAAVYNMATALVMPTVAFEMFGMAAVEAQACGTPVISSDHGGLRETVPNGAGLRFDTGSPIDLARKLERLATDAELRRALSAGAIANAARFSWESVCDRFEQLAASARPERSASPARQGVPWA